ncbi:MAG: helix-turn-helix domain-containing protein [Actinomycetota bacterium]|nr:helix-turn-helix domain-containing protein [Actinomycetota bacterium]
MIDAAEQIAAEQGLSAMSLRAVQAAAGQRNKSAAQYHFGSRDGLIERIVSHRMGPINERRFELLEALPVAPALHELVEVLVRPTAEAVLVHGQSHWARFVLAGIADPTVADVVRRNLEGHAFRAISRQLLDALDGLDAPLRQRRLDQAVGLLFLTLARAERGGVDDTEEVIADLVNVCTALLGTPPPSTFG